MKELELNSSVVREVFPYGDTTFGFEDVLNNILGGIDLDDVKELLDNDGDIYDLVDEELYNSLIYYEDQWEVMKHYQTPKEANFEDAWLALAKDIAQVLKGWYEWQKDSEDEE